MEPPIWIYQVVWRNYIIVTMVMQAKIRSYGHIGIRYSNSLFAGFGPTNREFFAHETQNAFLFWKAFLFDGLEKHAQNGQSGFSVLNTAGTQLIK